jgi:type III pantothenate kinase
MTFLAIDVGNTRLKWAVYEQALPGARLLTHGAEFLENIDKLAEGEWSNLPTPSAMLGCIVAGDAIRLRVREQIEHTPGWDIHPRWVVASTHEAGLVNGYDHPLRLGADRWVAMVGAHERMKTQHPQQHKPIVVVMVGTAVTVEAIDQSGKFLGGIILPGHGIMLSALESGTAGLHVPTGEVRTFPTNTSDALTSGGTFAIAGAISRMWNQLERHCGEKPVGYMTGGAAWKMAPHITKPMELVDTLIFDGLLAVASHRHANALARH